MRTRDATLDSWRRTTLSSVGLFRSGNTGATVVSSIMPSVDFDGEAGIRIYIRASNDDSEANPHLIKEYCGNSLRRVKTDETDAIKLRGMLLTTGTDLRDYTHMDTIRCLLQN